MNAARGIINAQTITESEQKIHEYLEKHNIPATTHFYIDPTSNLISFVIYINHKKITVPEDYEIDPSLKSLMIGLAIASLIDNKLLRIMGTITLVTPDGVYSYDPILVASRIKNSKNPADKTKYSQQNLSSVVELSYFMHGSRNNAIMHRPPPTVSGFAIFNEHTDDQIVEMVKNSIEYLYNKNVKDAILKIITNIDKYRARIDKLINLAISQSYQTVSITNIDINNLEDHSIIEVYFIGK